MTRIYWHLKNKVVNTQIIDIVNKHLIDVLTDFLKKHPKNKFLLQNSKGESLTHSELSSKMQAIRKRYDIPLEIRGMRHLTSSHCKLKLKFDDTQMKKLAEQFGTSRELPNPL